MVIIESVCVGLITGSLVSCFKLLSLSSRSLSLRLLSIFEQSGIYVSIRADNGKEVKLLPRINKEITYPWGTRFLVNLPVGKSTADLYDAKQAISEALRHDIEIRFDDGTILDVFNEKLTQLAPYRYEACSDWKVPIAVDRRGETIYFDFDGPYPNLLIGGLPGSGKSCVVRTIITSLIKTHHDRLDLFLVDLKNGIELVLFEPYKPVRSFATCLIDALKAVTEIERIMNERYEIMLRQNIRKWLGGRVVLFWDELADLITDDYADKDKKLKSAIKAKLRIIAAKGRAAGCWLVLSSQRPTVNVIDGNIRTNISTAIAFKTRDIIQSNTILDSPHAAHIEALPGRAIYQQGHRQETVQCLFLSDTDAESLLADVPKREVKSDDNESKRDTAGKYDDVVAIEPTSSNEVTSKGAKVGRNITVL